jgi:hypothetical protein
MTAQAVDATYLQNLLIPEGASAGPLPASTLRRAKLALGIVSFGSLTSSFGLMGVAVAQHDESFARAFLIGAGGVMLLFYVALFAQGLVSAIWLYRMWSWFPPEQRHTKLWKTYISPARAVLFLFIPYFNFYWMFVIYFGLGDIFDRMRVQYPTREPYHKNLALVSLLVPMVFFPLGPLFHYALDGHVEGLAREMESRMNRPIS